MKINNDAKLKRRKCVAKEELKEKNISKLIEKKERTEMLRVSKNV